MTAPEIVFYVLLALVLVALAILALVRLVRACTPAPRTYHPSPGPTGTRWSRSGTSTGTTDRSSDDGFAHGLMLGTVIASTHSHDSTPVSPSYDSHSSHSDSSSSSCDGGGGGGD